MRMNKEQLKNYLKNVNGQGYVQYISEGIVEIDNLSQIDVERHPLEVGFFDGDKSLTIRFIDGVWYVDEYEKAAEIDEKDKIEYLSILKGKKVIIGQVWEKEQDELCESLEVLKFRKNVFLGFKEQK